MGNANTDTLTIAAADDGVTPIFPFWVPRANPGCVPEAASAGTASASPDSGYVELPYTLVQDYTLVSVLGETTPKIWLEKVDFIEQYHGMALVNSHPDYLIQKTNWDMYHDFLIAMKNRRGYWHALPREAASWWRNRTLNGSWQGKDTGRLATASLRDGELVLESPEPDQGLVNSYAPISKPSTYWMNIQYDGGGPGQPWPGAARTREVHRDDGRIAADRSRSVNDHAIRALDRQRVSTPDTSH